MQRVEGEERSAKLKTSWSHHMANADDLLLVFLLAGFKVSYPKKKMKRVKCKYY